MINGEGKRLKKFKTNGLAKLEEFLKDFPFGDENKPCHAELLPLEDNKKAENYLTCAGNKLDPTWYAKFVWLGDEPPNAGGPRVSTSLKASNSDSGTSYRFYIKGGFISEDILTLVLLPIRGAKVPNRSPDQNKSFNLMGGKFKFYTQGSDLASFVGNGTKIRIPSDI